MGERGRATCFAKKRTVLPEEGQVGCAPERERRYPRGREFQRRKSQCEGPAAGPRRDRNGSKPRDRRRGPGRRGHAQG